MTYTEWKKIYRVSGEVAAILVINDLQISGIHRIVKFFPELVRYIRIGNLTSSMIYAAYKQDASILSHINLDGLDEYSRGELLYYVGEPIPNMNVSDFTNVSWKRALVCHPHLIETYRSEASKVIDVDFLIHNYHKVDHSESESDYLGM